MMDTIQLQKKTLRSELKERRAVSTVESQLFKSRMIFEFVQAFIAEKAIKIVHCYISMNDRNEVNTHPILEYFLSRQIHVLVPIMYGEMLEHCVLRSMTELTQNSWGVLEPSTKELSSINKVDIIFVPLLGVDMKGNRLGYGKGYYDRFLQNTKALKIGLVFSEFIVEEVPSEAHDVKLDGLITEKGVRLL